MWAQVLPQAGFSGLDFSLDDYTEQSSCTVIVATAAEMPENLTISPRRICEFSIVCYGLVKLRLCLLRLSNSFLGFSIESTATFHIGFQRLLEFKFDRRRSCIPYG